ncbi:MAG: selenocysteine protein, partial [Calditrichaeota bacterium]
GKLHRFLKKGSWREYSIASLLGVTPGCSGSFLNVSFYMHGFIGFGAIAAGMIATSGDEAFVMLARFPKEALIIFAILFSLALPVGWLGDRLVRYFRITTSERCDLYTIHSPKEEQTSGHYLKEHIWEHIIKGHLGRIFVWTFLAVLLVELAINFWPLEALVKSNPGWVLLVAVFVGIIPESGPHLIFVTLYAQGVIPFSVLLASSIAQDGHGLLPLLSYSFKDAMLIKLVNVGVALVIGGLFFLLGL